MRVALWLCAPLAALLWSPTFGYLGPNPGTENIPQLMADSTLVCKGEVVEAAALKISAGPSPPRLTAAARVHVDRCFKGELPPGGAVLVLFDSILPPAGGPYMG